MNLNICFYLFLFFLLPQFASSASPAYITYGAIESLKNSGRHLLQLKTKCSEDFSKKNYTILTSQCKGPNYPPEICCNSLKQFACPFVDAINNETTDCSSTMFSYINLYGKYPPGLFANTCKEGKEGLDCQSIKSSSPKQQTISFMIMVSSFFIGLLF